jgi:hypothetical protein
MCLEGLAGPNKPGRNCRSAQIPSTQLHLRHEPMGPPLLEGPSNHLTRLTFRPRGSRIEFRLR